MAKLINTNTGTAVFLNGHLLTPHPGNKIEEKDHKDRVFYLMLRSNGMCAETSEYVHFSFTNRYALKFDDEGRIVGLSFTEPLSYGDTISLLDTGKWGLLVQHYTVGNTPKNGSSREITLEWPEVSK